MEVWGEEGCVDTHAKCSYHACIQILIPYSCKKISLGTKNSTDRKYSHKVIVTQIRGVSL